MEDVAAPETPPPSQELQDGVHTTLALEEEPTATLGVEELSPPAKTAEVATTPAKTKPKARNVTHSAPGTCLARSMTCLYVAT